MKQTSHTSDINNNGFTSGVEVNKSGIKDAPYNFDLGSSKVQEIRKTPSKLHSFS